jgi:uncharacterized membrane protein (UPF0127 family)
MNLAEGARLRALAALPALAMLACAGKPPEAPHPPPPRVVIETADGGRHTVTVEVARTDAEHERGLMYRQDLAEDAGMLFVFPESAPRAFWMKNTLVPLDMLFIDEAGVVAGLVRDAEPLTLTPRGPGPGISARYVLEVRGGWAARHGVGPGARVRMEDVPRW